MSIEKIAQVVKDFFAAMGSGDKQALTALVAEDIERIILGENWPLAGTHRGHAGVTAALRKASEEVEMTYPKPRNVWRKETVSGHRRRCGED